MILTGKAKEDFGMYLVNTNKNADWETFYKLPESFKNALIIGWFDSVGNLNHNGAGYNFKTLYLSTFKQLEKHHSILDIQKIAIKKANEIYNTK